MAVPLQHEYCIHRNRQYNFVLILADTFYAATQISEMELEIELLPRRAQLAAAFITYLASQPEDERHRCLDLWLQYTGLPGQQSAIILIADVYPNKMSCNYFTKQIMLYDIVQ